MSFETDFYIVDDIEKVPYFKDIAKELDDKAIEIISFFEILNKKKTKIVFWDDIDAYKEHLKKHNVLYRSDICADTMDNNINVLTLDAAHKTDVYKDMTLEQLRQNISHEFVHVCQNSLEEENVDDRNAWFCEALATNLGNPEQFGKLIYIMITKEELENFNSIENNRYETAYTIGRYLLENFSPEEILEFVKYPSKLDRIIVSIIRGTQDWMEIQSLNK